jgi:hypothetical protein
VATLQTTNLKNEANAGPYNVQMTSDGSILVANSVTVYGAATIANGLSVSTALVPPTSFSRNRFINGSFQVAQRVNNINTAVTVANNSALPTASAGYPCVDRWFVVATGQTATAKQDTAADGTSRRLVINPVAGTSNTIYVGQRIEANNSLDLAGQTVTVSVYTYNTVATTISFTLNYGTGTASAGTSAFGTIASPTKTAISPIGGVSTWTVTGTLARYTVSFIVPSAAVNGLEFVMSVAGQNSGDWVIQNAQLEVGGYATPFEYKTYQAELAACQRYLPAWNCTGSAAFEPIGTAQGLTATTVLGNFPLPVPARVKVSGLVVTNAARISYVLAAGTVTVGSAFAYTYGSTNMLSATLTTTGAGAGSVYPIGFGTAGTNVDNFYATGCEIP